MCSGCRFIAAGQYKAIQSRKLAVDDVDLMLNAGDVLFSNDAGGMRCLVFSFGGKIGSQSEQFVLQVSQESMIVAVCDQAVEPSHMAVQFIEGTVSFQSQMCLWNPRSTHQCGGTLVSCFCIDDTFFHSFFSCKLSVIGYWL